MGKYSSDDEDALSDFDLFSNVEVVDGISPENLIGKQFPVAGVSGVTATIKYAPSATNAVETSDVVRPDGTCKLPDAKEVIEGLAKGTHLFPTATVDGKNLQPVQLVQQPGSPNQDNIMVALFNSADALKIAEIMSHHDARRRSSSKPPAAVEHELHSMLLEASRKGVDSAAVKDYFSAAERKAFESTGIVLPKKTADNLASKFRRKAKAARKAPAPSPVAKRQRTLEVPKEPEKKEPEPKPAPTASKPKWTLTVEGTNPAQLAKFAELLGSH